MKASNGRHVGRKAHPDGRHVRMEGTSEWKARPDGRHAQMEGTSGWKARPDERPTALTTSRGKNIGGAVVSQLGEGHRGCKFSRVTKIEFFRFSGEDAICKNNNVAWDLYTEAILQRYGIAYDEPFSEIKKLRHTSIIQDYIDVYDKLLCIVDLSE
ncbi:hypothetical protein Tco_0718584 [Tanacetum coccineum]